VSLVGGVNETLVVKGQAAIPYKNVDKEKQKEALAALHEQLFKTQKWLFEPSLISKFEGDGHLDLISNLQKAALYRLMSTDRLNRMLSTTVTLEGDGMHPDELIESLAQGLMYKNSQPDLFERNLQLAFIERIKELLSDEKAHAEVKSILFKQSESLKKWLKKQERSATSQLRGHFGYAQKRLTAE